MIGPPLITNICQVTKSKADPEHGSTDGHDGAGSELTGVGGEIHELETRLAKLPGRCRYDPYRARVRKVFCGGGRGDSFLVDISARGD